MDNGLRNQSITGELGARGQVMKLLPVEQLIPGDILGITCSPTAWLTSAGSHCFLTRCEQFLGSLRAFQDVN